MYLVLKLNFSGITGELHNYLYHECERAGQKIYLFIDEYDHFTNAILSDAESLYRYMEETHREGYCWKSTPTCSTATSSS